MSLAENKALVRRWFEEVWNGGNLDVIDDLVAPDAVYTDPATGEHSGPEGARALVSGYRKAYPDIYFEIEEQIAEADRVATRWTARGTHRGELMGIQPTGKQTVVTGIDVQRVADGKLAGGVVSWDALGMFRQLGTVPEQIDMET